MNKKNTFKGLCLSLMMIAGGLSAQAQLEQSVYLNGSLPTAQFNDPVVMTDIVYPGDLIAPTSLGSAIARDEAGKGATAGFGMGYRLNYSFDVGFGEVAPFLNADFQWNQLKSEYRDAYNNQRAKSSTYFNIPIMIGIQYRYDLTDIFKVFGELSLGYDAYLITASGWKDDEFRPFYKYNVGGALCWQVGVGSFFGTHVSAGLHYYGLGKHNIDLNKHSNNAYMGGNEIVAIPANVDDGSTVVSRRIGSLMLRIGFHF